MGHEHGGAYERLDATKVRATIDRLGVRIDTFLPGHPGLRAVTDELGSHVDDLIERADTAPRRRDVLDWLARLLIVVVVAAAVVAMVSAVRDAVSGMGRLRAFEWLPVLESGINDLVFAGIAIWFLLSLADRVSRNDLLGRLHRLRSMAHIIDMHQMSKDPAALLPDRGPSDATGQMTRREYAIYLDYCSELLSLTSKAAALCAEESTDPLILDTVSEIETLTTSMSRKIWQKISLLHSASGTTPPLA